MTDTAQLSINRKECPKCGALWLNGVHYWSTGSKGNELDLAGLVCNTTQSSLCINAMKGKEGGDTWEKRLKFLEKMEAAPQSNVGVWGADFDGLD